MKRPFNTRWRLTKAILWLTTVAFFIPTLINWFAQFFYKDILDYQELTLISSGEWVSLLLAVIGMYQLFNVAREHKSLNGRIVEKDLEKADKQELIEDEGD